MNKWKLFKSYSKSIVGGSVGFMGGAGVVYVTKPFYTVMDDPSNAFPAVFGLLLDGFLAVGVGLWGGYKGWKKGPCINLSNCRDKIKYFSTTTNQKVKNHLQKRADQQP
jgi:hypothetical protein